VSKRYWEIFEKCRSELGYADYLAPCNEYRLEQPHDLQPLRVSLFLLDYRLLDACFPALLMSSRR